MITIRSAQDRGIANFGWLDSRHTFSFGSYHDSNHVGFADLRVINEDKVALLNCRMNRKSRPHPSPLLLGEGT